MKALENYYFLSETGRGIAVHGILLGAELHEVIPYEVCTAAGEIVLSPFQGLCCVPLVSRGSASLHHLPVVLPPLRGLNARPHDSPPLAG